MKYKITHRLIGYFSAVLLLFSLITGILFGIQFTWHTARIHEGELREQAVSMAGTISLFRQRQSQGGGKGYGAYLRFVNDTAKGEVWLVDENARTIELDTGNYSLSYSKLPEGTETLIRRIFQGEVASNKAFSPLLDQSSITVGAPVLDGEGNVIAALLLHSPVNGILDAKLQSVFMLIACILLALILSFALSVLLAHHFITPLKDIGLAVGQVMAGNYSARIRVDQNDEIGALASNINNLFARLADIEQERKKLDKIQKDFMSNVSHELRTPLTVIKGSLEVLEQGLVTDPQQMEEYFHQMLSDAAHLERLVNDLLELSRLQNSSFQISKTTLNLTDILTESVRSMQMVADKKQVKICFDNEVGLALFQGDYGRLRQMFTTVLDNAVKFSPAGAVVTVALSFQDGQYLVTVADRGSGIPPEDIPYIFNRFYKDHSTQNRTGSGLGLPIAKQIADRHGISISCASICRDSTVFSFLLTQKEGPESPKSG